MVSTELINNICLVLITGVLTIVASITTQIVINRQKRSDFLKEKEWGPLLSLSSALTDLWLHAFNATGPFNKEKVDDNMIIICFEEMKKAEAYIMLTGKKKIIGSFWILYQSMQCISEHYLDNSYKSLIQMHYETIKTEAMTVVKNISSFLRS